MGYLTVVIVLHPRAGGWQVPLLGRKTGQLAWKISSFTAVDRDCSKTYFSHLKKGPSIKISITFKCYFHLAVRQPFKLGTEGVISIHAFLKAA